MIQRRDSKNIDDAGMGYLWYKDATRRYMDDNGLDMRGRDDKG